MEQKTFTVPAIGCDGCIRTIKSEVGQLPGVQWVEGDENTKLVTVAWETPASWDGIRQTLTDIEYAPQEA